MMSGIPFPKAWFICLSGLAFSKYRVYVIIHLLQLWCLISISCSKLSVFIRRECSELCPPAPSKHSLLLYPHTVFIKLWRVFLCQLILRLQEFDTGRTFLSNYHSGLLLKLSLTKTSYRLEQSHRWCLCNNRVLWQEKDQKKPFLFFPWLTNMRKVLPFNQSRAEPDHWFFWKFAYQRVIEGASLAILWTLSTIQEYQPALPSRLLL